MYRHLHFMRPNHTGKVSGGTDMLHGPLLKKMILFALMLIGACSGSTAGGIKVSRMIILIKTIIVEIKHVLHPHSFNSVRLGGKTVSKEILRGTLVYFVIVIFFIGFGSILLSIEGHDLITTVSSVATCISNVGPGFAGVGPVQNFSFYSAAAKLLLLIYMLLGRLEMFPMIILFNPNTKKKKWQ